MNEIIVPQPVRPRVRWVDAWIFMLTRAAHDKAASPQFRGYPERRMSPRQFARSRGFANAKAMAMARAAAVARLNH